MLTMKPIATALTLAGSLAAGQALAADVAVNGDFEAASLAGWSNFDPALFTLESSSPQEGNFNGKFTNTNDGGSAVIAKQANLAAGLLTPNADITVSFYARGSAANGGVHFAELFSELDGGGVSKSELLGGAPLFPASDTVWQFYSFDTTLGPDVSGGVTLQFAAVTGAVSGSVSILEIDDVQVNTAVSAIPEPASALLFGLGGLAVLGGRRRRAH